MSYLIMVMMGFIMIGIGATGYLKSNVILKHTVSKVTYLVDNKGTVVQQINDPSIFDKYEIKIREKL